MPGEPEQFPHLVGPSASAPAASSVVIIGPPTRRTRPKPIALVTPGYRALSIETLAGVDTIHGAKRCYDALERYDGHVLFTTGSLTHFRHTTGAKVWQGGTWRGRTVSMTLDGTRVKIHSLRGTLEGSPDPFGDLVTAITWLATYGVAPASISSMGWSLWRHSLTREYRISTPPALGRSALYGGRQGIPANSARTYQHMVGADITAAYPWSMQARPYALSLRQVSASTTINADDAGMVQGTVAVPFDMPFGPVPLRVAPDMICFPTGIIEGTWSWAEAMAAEALGCEVLVDKCWAPAVEADLFEEWWPRVAEGRELGGRAATLVKGCANSLWGMFGMRGDDREAIRWEDDAGLRPLRIDLGAAKLPHHATAHIAAETAARVRVRMLSEGCYGSRGGPGAPVHIDTDGIIIRRSALDAMGTAAVPGEWRKKTVMRKVEIRAPQVYRYQCGSGCGVAHRSWHYSVAGVPAEAAERLFDGVGQRGISVAFNGTDMVLPAFNVHDQGAKERAMAMATSAKAVGE